MSIKTNSPFKMQDQSIRLMTQFTLLLQPLVFSIFSFMSAYAVAINNYTRSSSHCHFEDYEVAFFKKLPSSEPSSHENEVSLLYYKNRSKSIKNSRPSSYNYILSLIDLTLSSF